MRKSRIEASEVCRAEGSNWLNLEQIASVEISSEDEQFPIENVFKEGGGAGWRAGSPGPQTIRLRFDRPQKLRAIALRMVEPTVERMQELAVYIQSDGRNLQEVRRQQFTFSPGGSTEEVEEFSVDLEDVELLEIRIDPDRSHNPADSRSYATLASLRLA